MRKITEAAANAFKAGRNFSRDNTMVSVAQGTTQMHLHGNLIAVQYHSDPNTVKVTLAGWGTPTTRERVNGLLTVMGARAAYYQKNHRQIFVYGAHHREVSSNDWQTVRIRNEADCDHPNLHSEAGSYYYCPDCGFEQAS